MSRVSVLCMLGCRAKSFSVGGYFCFTFLFSSCRISICFLASGISGGISSARKVRPFSVGSPALTLFLTLTRARALLARQRSAGCYGVAPNEMGSRQNSLGPPALTPLVSLTRAREGQAVVPLLRGRSPTRSVAPKPLRGLGRASLRHFGLARGCRRIWRGVSGKQGDS